MSVWSGLARVLWLWLPPVAWMGILFGFSAESQPMPQGVQVPDWITHGTAYGILGGLFCRAMAGGLLQPLTRRRAVAAVALATLYGVSDEYHQSFVPQRDADPWDIAKDLGGAALGSLAVYELGRRGQAWGAARSPGSPRP